MHERFVNSHKFTNQRGRFCAIYLRALGEGGDAFIAASAAQKFMRIGYQTTASSDFDSQLIALSQMTPEDALICISHSGKTRNICSLAKVAREHGIKVITITNFPGAPLAKHSDILLLTASFSYDVMDEVLAKRVPAPVSYTHLDVYKRQQCSHRQTHL